MLPERILSVISAVLIAVPAVAQDAEGNDRPSNWRVTYQETREGWDTVCDERGEGPDFIQRCYLRRVDVFSPRPEFAAQFLFVTASENGASVEFGIEPGTLFVPGNFRILRDGASVWSSLHPGCLTGLSCTYSGQDAVDLLAEMETSDSFAFDFRDRHGKQQSLRWPLARVGEGLNDLQDQLRARNLPALPDRP
ncbi:hypothetical protein [Aliiroseovarius sp. 2305UL8-7]|uniref:hypothetical protein n=1 Tax=Aliiroseovarius conchicola TaxID=3121637 RepID=UPI00352707E5